MLSGQQGGSMSIPGKVLSFCLVLAAAAMQPAIAVAQTSLDELARDVDRAESMRAVKNLQRTYAQYSQYGLWNEMADLFAREATYTFDEETIKGRKAIFDYLTSHQGGPGSCRCGGAIKTRSAVASPNYSCRTACLVNTHPT
jgi:hypothetical protein